MHNLLMAIRKANDNGNISIEDAIKSIEEDMEHYWQDLRIEAYIYKTKEEIIESSKSMIEGFKSKPEIMDIYNGISKEEWLEKYLSTLTFSDIDGAYEENKRKADVLKGIDKAKDEDYIEYFKEFNYCEDSDFDSDGNLINRCNPEGYWDYWSFGGRWDNIIDIYESSKSKYGGKEAVNIAKVKDIDWGKMYNDISPETIGKLTRYWDTYVLGKPYPGTKEEKIADIGYCHYSAEYYLKHFGTLEKFLDSQHLIHAETVLTNDGKWVDRYQENPEIYDTPEDKWIENFYSRFIENLEPEDIIAFIDYHF